MSFAGMNAQDGNMTEAEVMTLKDILAHHGQGGGAGPIPFTSSAQGQPTATDPSQGAGGVGQGIAAGAVAATGGGEPKTQPAGKDAPAPAWDILHGVADHMKSEYKLKDLFASHGTSPMETLGASPFMPQNAVQPMPAPQLTNPGTAMSASGTPLLQSQGGMFTDPTQIIGVGGLGAEQGLDNQQTTPIDDGVATEIRNSLHQGDSILNQLKADKDKAVAAMQAVSVDPKTGKSYPFPETVGLEKVIGGKHTIADILTVIGALVAASTGPSGQQLAAGIMQGFLGGKQTLAATQNQDVQNQFRYDSQQRAEAAKSALDLFGITERQYGAWTQYVAKLQGQQELNARTKGVSDDRRAGTLKSVLDQGYPSNATAEQVERILRAKQSAAQSMSEIPGYENTAQISDDDIKKEVAGHKQYQDEKRTIVNSHFTAVQFARTSALAQSAFTQGDAVKYLTESLKYTDDPEQKKAILADIRDYQSGKLTPRALSDQEKRVARSIEAQLRVNQDTINKLWESGKQGVWSPQYDAQMQAAEAEQDRLLGQLQGLGSQGAIATQSPSGGASDTGAFNPLTGKRAAGEFEGQGTPGRLPTPSAKPKPNAGQKQVIKQYDSAVRIYTKYDDALTQSEEADKGMAEKDKADYYKFFPDRRPSVLRSLRDKAAKDRDAAASTLRASGMKDFGPGSEPLGSGFLDKAWGSGAQPRDSRVKKLQSDAATAIAKGAPKDKVEALLRKKIAALGKG